MKRSGEHSYVVEFHWKDTKEPCGGLSCSSESLFSRYQTLTSIPSTAAKQKKTLKSSNGDSLQEAD